MALAPTPQVQPLTRMSLDPMQSPYNRAFNSMWPASPTGRTPTFIPAGWAAPPKIAPPTELLQHRQFSGQSAEMP